ncbi:transcriptional regulator [Frankia sp. CcI49]|uniref:helix-turn-helix transcriptional regulator n=1 Tax=Frankia sp. CcI49 TaxID=1745382 RepID=UPI0009769365|nr:helix-turn-helix transcriptional regulator [Frankia sp. CcI49]ONH58155.1 transcriptional regulator [Frankia sp. CcI49]
MADDHGMGAFLRDRRARVQPADVGLPGGPGPRRTRGLRREELAALAGVSVDYYTRIEQGRETAPSDAVLDALARVLRLDDHERAYLFTLADHAARRAPRQPVTPSRVVRPGLAQLLESVRTNPAFVLSQLNDILAANPEGLALLVGIDRWPVGRRNLIRYVFLDPASRTVFVDWERIARNTVAHLRAVSAASSEPADLTALVEELSASSAEFAELWRTYDVRVKTGSEIRFRHPAVGEFSLRSEILGPGPDGQRFVVYQAAPGSRDQDALVLLAMTIDGGSGERVTS